jgi:hypothetical protein
MARERMAQNYRQMPVRSETSIIYHAALKSVLPFRSGSGL